MSTFPVKPMTDTDHRNVMQIVNDLNQLREHLERSNRVGAGHPDLDALFLATLEKTTQYYNDFFKTTT